MLDEKTTKLIMVAVKQDYGIDIPYIDTIRMKSLEVSSSGGAPVVSIQRGNMTILARMNYSPEGHLLEPTVKVICW